MNTPNQRRTDRYPRVRPGHRPGAWHPANGTRPAGLGEDDLVELRGHAGDDDRDVFTVREVSWRIDPGHPDESVKEWRLLGRMIEMFHGALSR